jgi:UDP-galactose transporter B1
MIRNLWSSFQREITLVFIVTGIYVSYIYYGYLQEEITTTEFGENKEKFSFILFLMFVQCVSNTLASIFAIKITKQKSYFLEGTVSSFSFIGFSYLLGMYSSYWALNYVNFPTTILVKSSKMIPVMLVGTFLFGKRWKLREYLCMLMVVLGIFQFMYYRKGYISDKTNSILGLFLILVSLTADGITGALQDHLLVGNKPSTHQLMFGTNFWATIYLFIGTLVTNEGFQAIEFAKRNNEIVWDILMFCIVSAVGQNFIFASISHFGALSCSIITTTRKFFTIFFSVLWFRHPITPMQVLGAVLVFVGLGWDAYGKSSTPEAKKHQKST